MCRRIIVLFVLSFPSVLSFSQTVLSITGSSNLFIASGTTISLDSLVLTPSAGYNLTGTNNLTHNTTLTNGSTTPSINRAYSLTNALTGYSGSITVYYLSSELNSLSAPTLQVNAFNNSWTHYTGTDGTNFATASALSNISFSELSLASSSSPLPLLWLSLSATRDNGTVDLRWSTTDETNCKDFQVQRSTNGADYTNPAPPLTARNTPGPNAYTWTDSSAFRTITYYRIRESDYDNAYSYSSIVVARAATGNVMIYPNPVTTGTFSVLVTAPGTKMISIYNSAGMLYQQVSFAGSAQDIPTTGWPKGFYLLRIAMADGSIVSEKVVVQ